MIRIDNQLGIHDLKNISLWYERVTSKHDDVTQSDKRTMIKIQAMLIYQEEELQEREDGCGLRRY